MNKIKNDLISEGYSFVSADDLIQADGRIFVRVSVKFQKEDIILASQSFEELTTQSWREARDVAKESAILNLA